MKKDHIDYLTNFTCGEQSTILNFSTFKLWYLLFSFFYFQLFAFFDHNLSFFITSGFNNSAPELLEILALSDKFLQEELNIVISHQIIRGISKFEILEICLCDFDYLEKLRIDFPPNVIGILTLNINNIKLCCHHIDV